MKEMLCFGLLILLVSSCQGKKPSSGEAQTDSVRHAAFADKFYPGDPAKLRNAIKAFLEDARPPVLASTVAIIVPHAGYIFAGQIMADGYNQVRHREFDVVVVLGTNHTTPGFTGISVYPKGAFETPLGNAEIDEAIADKLLKDDPDVTADLRVHTQEHSIEVQLPFIQCLFPQAKIVPIVVGEPDVAMCNRFGVTLAGALKGKRALIVASSDLSHYPRFEDAAKVDNVTLKTIVTLDLDKIRSVLDNELEKGVPQLATCACGEAPIMAAIAAAKELGAHSASIVSYTNSGYNPVGTTEQVVGYGAVAIGNGTARQSADIDSIAADHSYELTISDKKSLLKYARATIERYFQTSTVPLPRDLSAELNVKRGAFVTLNEHGELRGCIGNLSGDRPLGTAVGAMALQAALNDPRFPPVAENELSNLDIEISVLTPFKQVKSADDIVLGRDGVIVKKGDRQAVFLPQVATETGWTKEKFLDELCYKAGLNAGDWKSAQLFTFQANVFSESEIERPEH